MEPPTITAHNSPMSRKIMIIDGHPDPSPHFGHALATAYAAGARAAGHKVKRINLAKLDIPLLRSAESWAKPPVRGVTQAQQTIAWAEHLAIFFPLWLGDMPALLKAFFEQVMRPGFAFREGEPPGRAALLGGRSAQIVVTMGMPAFWYRSYYRAHSVKSLERNILKLVGIKPVQYCLIGGVGPEMSNQQSWLDEMFGLGEAGKPAG
jgi:putative NADPH-quinone reductase